MSEKLSVAQPISFKELLLYSASAISLAVVIGEAQEYPEKPETAAVSSQWGEYDSEHNQFILNMCAIGSITIGSAAIGARHTAIRITNNKVQA